MKGNKIIRFNNINDFENFLSNDKEFKRFPTRFILLHDLDSWKKVVGILDTYCDTKIKLSECSLSDDAFPVGKEVVEKAEKYLSEENIVLLYPLSEILRFTKGTDILSKLANIQKDPNFKGKLYVPLLDDGTFESFWEKIPDVDERRHSAIEVVSPQSHDTINIYVTDESKFSEIVKKTEKCIIVEGASRYFKIWENIEKITNNIFVCSRKLSSLLSELSQMGNQPYITGNVKVMLIKNFRDLLNEVLSFSVSIPYEKEEEKFWEKLAKEVVKKKEFKNFVRLAKFKLNVQHFEVSLFSKWKELDDFSKWILYQWSKLEVRDDSYLGLVLSNSNFLNFEAQLWNFAFKTDLDINKIKERISILRLTNIEPPDGYMAKLKTIKDPLTKLKILTGITEEEKTEIIKSFGEFLAKQKEDLAVKEILDTIFPEFSSYYYNLHHTLSSSVDDKFLPKYFRAYLKAKILNQYISELELASNELKNFNLYKYPTRNSVLENYTCDKIIVMDGLGIEWLGLIIKLLEEKGLNFEFPPKITRVNLPSTTEFNQINGALKIDDLDQTYHKIHHEYANLILAEITAVCSLVKRLSEIIKENNEIVITGDHGGTRFSGWPEDRIIIENEDMKIEKEGRYAVIESGGFDETEDFIVENLNGRTYLISRNHKVFKGGKKVAYGETHGGATPEEVLVPVIVVRKESETLSSQINVEVYNKEVSYINPVITIEFSEKVSEVSVSFKGKTIRAKSINNFQWEANLIELGLKPGEYEININFKTPDLATKSEKIVIRIKAGMVEEDLFGGEF